MSTGHYHCDMADEMPGTDAYHALRSQALTIDLAEIGAPPGTVIFGLLMDTTYSNGTATLAAFGDGTVSLYLSTGGGILGSGRHEAVAVAALRLLVVAERYLAAFAPSDADELPPEGWTRITVRTAQGRLSVTAPEADFGYGRELASPVFEAAHEVISELRQLQEGPDPDPDPGSGPDQDAGQALPGSATPLMAAAYLGDAATAADLIASGADVDATDEDGYTALMYAANAGHDDLVRLLLTHGANPNACDNDLSSPLMFAAQHGHLDILTQLLAAGADVTARGTHGLTALGFTRQNGHDRAESLLRKAGATD